MTERLAQNLAALARLSPEMAALVGQRGVDPAMGQATTLDRRPVLEIAGRALDSRRDPRGQAAAEAAAVDAPRVVLAGFGTGYLAEALIDRGIDLATIIVDRPESLAGAMVALDLSRLLDRVPVTCLELLRESLDVAVLRARAPRLVCHGPSLSTSSDLAALAAAWDGIPVADRPPRVLVVGPMAGGSLGPAVSTAAAARACGADVTFFDASDFAAGFRALARSDLATARQGQLTEIIGHTIADEAIGRQADLVVALAQAPLHAAALGRLRDAGIRTAFWFVENCRVLTYWRDLAAAYDRFFAIQPGTFLDRLHDAGAPQPAYLPMACDPDRHRPVALTSHERTRFGSDVSFAGAAYLNRRSVFAGLTDYDLRLWGPGWTDPALARVAAGAGLEYSPEEMIRIVAASTINLNLHSAAHVTGLDPEPDYVNPRTFEIAACGGFQLVDRREPLADLFEADEVVSFGTLEALRPLIDRYLTADDERAAIAERGRARALRDHTYAHRVRSIFREALSPALAAAAIVGVATESIDEAIATHEHGGDVTRDELLLRVLREIGLSHGMTTTRVEPDIKASA